MIKELKRSLRKWSGTRIDIFDVEEIEMTPLSNDIGEDTNTRTINVKSHGKWTGITLFGKDLESTKIKEVNTWE